MNYHVSFVKITDIKDFEDLINYLLKEIIESTASNCILNDK